MFANTNDLALCKQPYTHPLLIFFRIFLGYMHRGTRLYTILFYSHGWLVCIDRVAAQSSFLAAMNKISYSDTSQSKLVLSRFLCTSSNYHCYFICYFLNFCIWASLYMFTFAFPLIQITWPFLCPFTFGNSYLFSYGFRSTYLINPEIMPPLVLDINRCLFPFCSVNLNCNLLWCKRFIWSSLGDSLKKSLPAWERDKLELAYTQYYI